MNSRHIELLLAFAIGAAVLLPGCGGGSGGSGGGGTPGASTADFLVMDAPADDLLSFSARIQELRLVSSSGQESANLLPAGVTTEFVGLQSTQAWLAHASPAPGTYGAVKLVLDPSSISARDMSGAGVAIDVLGNTLTAPFTTALVVDDSGYHHVVIDLDLAASLTGAVATPPITFDPHGLSSSDDGALGVEIEDIRGVVTSKDANAQTFAIDAFVDEDLSVHLGPVDVALQPSTLLLGTNGTPISSSAFFAALLVDHTLLEVRGQLSSGVVQAQAVTIEDHSGGSGSTNQVKITGLVSTLGPGSTFGLLIQHIEKGAAIAAPVLASLGNPAVIAVLYDSNTVFSIDHTQTTTPSALTLGQRVKVEFPSFANTPFLASEVEIDDGPHFEGVITGLAGLPTTLLMHLDSDSPAIAAGQVASSSTDVTVQLGSSTMFLDTSGHPTLQGSQLLAGLKLEVHGAISGPPSAPSIAASQVKIKPGRFKGTVATVSQATSSFVSSVTELEDPFGDNVTSGPFTVHIAQGCVFEHDASSSAGFFAMFASLQPGQTLRVRVKGIGSGAANEVSAHEIEVELH